MEIDGCTFRHQSSASTVEVYLIKNNVEVWHYRGWYYEGAVQNLDTLIDLLEKHIAESEVSNG